MKLPARGRRGLSHITILYLLLSSNAISNDNLALPCLGCHGPGGNSPGDSIPSISGLSKEYFIKSFNAYKYDTRDNYIMRIIAKGYTEKQIISMSKYFNQQVSNNVK